MKNNFAISLVAITLRFILHLFLSAIVFLTLNFIWEVTAFWFVLGALIAGVLGEYLEYSLGALQDLSLFTIKRDLTLFLAGAISFVFLIYSKDSLDQTAMIVGLNFVAVLLCILSFYIDSNQPKLNDYKFKHVVDVTSYTLGPFFLYSTLLKVFF